MASIVLPIMSALMIIVTGALLHEMRSIKPRVLVPQSTAVNRTEGPCMNESMDACVATRECTWCMSNTMCQPRGAPGCENWCGQPYFMIEMEPGGGFTNQKMATIAATLVARQFNGVLVAPRFMSRTKIEFPANAERVLHYRLDELFDPGFYDTMAPHACVTRTERELGTPVRPNVFKYSTRSYEAWAQVLTPLLNDSNVIHLDYPGMGYEVSSLAWARDLYHIILSAMRPAPSQQALVTHLLATMKCTAAIHLRVEDDMVTNFPDRLPNLEAMLRHLQPVAAQRVYVATGLHKSASDLVSTRYTSALCQLVVCVWKEDLLANYTGVYDDRLFDVSASIDYEILLTLPMVYLTRYSSVDWLVALTRQRDHSKHHLFYDSATASGPLQDLPTFPTPSTPSS